MRCAFLFFSLLVFSAHAEPIRETIKIGAILPLTGDAASWGEAVRNGIELARSKLPADDARQIDVVYEDDQRNPRLAALAFRKLVETDKAVAVIGITAQPGLAVAPLAEELRIPFISIAVPKKISEGRQYTVMLYATAERMANAMADEAISRGYRSIARINSIHDGRLAMRENFDRAIGDKLKVVLDEEYAIDSKDFRPFLAKVKQRSDVDAIYINLVLGQAGLAARQARELGLKQPLFESEMFEDPAEVALSKGALVGEWFVNQADAPPEFLNEYEERFPGSKVFNATNGYDAFMMLAGAAQQGTTPREMNEAIHSLRTYKGVLGKYVLLPDNRFDLPAAVKEVLPKGFKTLRTVRIEEPSNG